MLKTDSAKPSIHWHCKYAMLAVALCSVFLSSGCVQLNVDSARRLAYFTKKYVSTNSVKVIKNPERTWDDQLRVFVKGNATPSDRTLRTLRQYGLEEDYQKYPEDTIIKLQEHEVIANPLERIFAIAELSKIQGDSYRAKLNNETAKAWYTNSTMYAYEYLFNPAYSRFKNVYDNQFRGAADLYNSSLEGVLKIMRDGTGLRPGAQESIQMADDELTFKIEMQGPWHDEDIESFEFVSEYEVEGIKNQYSTFGLGVPLIAIRKKHADESPGENYFPEGLSFPMTAFLHVAPVEKRINGKVVRKVTARLVLYDPLLQTQIRIGDSVAPIESDITTPLAYFLNDPLRSTNVLATLALFDAEFGSKYRGLYMLEPYDPNKIPVVMIHGLWSSPMTWMQLFNDLRSMEDIRKNYQFWFFLYPSGQTIWASAKQFRDELKEANRILNPDNNSFASENMVLIGHSMGGLVGKLQTIESKNSFWEMVSNEPFEQLDADDSVKQELRDLYFFQPNRSIRRLVTIATPHHGSHFANSTTTWLSKKFFRFPANRSEIARQLRKRNPGYFSNTRLLEIDTSIESLTPESPMFAALENAVVEPGTRLHNIIGASHRNKWSVQLGEKITGMGDGVVAVESARIDDADSELIVDEEHTKVHQHPASMAEVRRVLIEHLKDYKTQLAQRQESSLANRQDSSAQNSGNGSKSNSHAGHSHSSTAVADSPHSHHK